METRIDSKRGCGWRQPGGLYLINNGRVVACGKLPIPLTICPTCSGGIHFARGWTWVNGLALVDGHTCKMPLQECASCLLFRDAPRLERCGLLWVGEKFYKTPEAYMKESVEMGISRRIPNLPNDFKAGETIVLLAHIRAIVESCQGCDGTGFIQLPSKLKLDDGEEVSKEDAEAIQFLIDAARNVKCPQCEGEGKEFGRGIFSAFVPTAVEYVTKGDETPEQLAAMEKRGITPVRVVRSTEIQAMEVSGDA